MIDSTYLQGITVSNLISYLEFTKIYSAQFQNQTYKLINFIRCSDHFLAMCWSMEFDTKNSILPREPDAARSVIDIEIGLGAYS